MLTHKAMYEFLDDGVHGEPLPVPDPTCSKLDSDLEEPIYLVSIGASRVAFVPKR
jgi:hypothetical protein